MKGHFYRRGCKCKKKRCTCGATWTFVLDMGTDPITGKRKQKSKGGFNTKQEAELAANTLIHELNKGTYIEESDETFKNFSKEWINLYFDTNNVKPGTIRVRQHEISKLMPYFSQIKLKDINRKMYQDALDDLKDEGYADNTIDGIHRTGRMIFRKALELELIKKDPTEFIYLKKDKKTIIDFEIEQEVPKYLEKEELALFLNTAKHKGLDMDHLMFMLLSYTGIRVGELVSLKWIDINFINQSISITKTYYNPTSNIKKYQLVSPKTKKSYRKIIVDDDVLDELKKHKTVQNNIKMRYRNTYNDKGFIFASNDYHPGYPIYIKKVQLRMKRLLKLAGLNENLTPHSLRHTHTSLLAEAKVSLEQIMDRLGHTDDHTTKNIYLHVTKELKKDASKKFGLLMRSLQK